MLLQILFQEKCGRLPTLPLLAVPSAFSGFTSLFGMGRGRSTATITTLDNFNQFRSRGYKAEKNSVIDKVVVTRPIQRGKDTPKSNIMLTMKQSNSSISSTQSIHVFGLLFLSQRS